MQPLLDPQYVTSVVPQRPTDDGMGNTTWADLSAVDVVIWAGAPGLMSGAKGPLWSESAQVFARRGSDLKSGDRIPYQGSLWVLSGTPAGDQVHPFTGHDFGWMAFSVEGPQ